MSDFNIPYPAEQFLACRALVVGAKNASDGMERFIHWMLAGFAGALIYLLGQSHIPVESLRPVATLFIVAAFIGVIQRYLAMIVTVGTSTFQEAEKLNDKDTQIDAARFFIVYIEALPAISRWAAAWSARRVLSGNLTSAGRGLANFAIAQCILGFCCTVLLLVGFYQVLDAVNHASLPAS